ERRVLLRAMERKLAGSPRECRRETWTSIQNTIGLFGISILAPVRLVACSPSVLFACTIRSIGGGAHESSDGHFLPAEKQGATLPADPRSDCVRRSRRDFPPGLPPSADAQLGPRALRAPQHRGPSVSRARDSRLCHFYGRKRHVRGRAFASFPLS